MTGAGQWEEFKELTHNRKPAPRIEREIRTRQKEGGTEKVNEIKPVCVCVHYIQSLLASPPRDCKLKRFG